MTSPKEPTGKTEKIPGILDFMFEQKMDECSVCRLPQEARDQLAIARKKREINRDAMIAYLRKYYGWQGEDEDLTLHSNGHHDRKLKELQA